MAIYFLAGFLLLPKPNFKIMFNSFEKYFDQDFNNLTVEIEEHFEGIEFEKCNFRNCNFQGWIFSNCKFLDCNFSKSNLSNLKISGSILNGNRFNECKLLGIDFAKTSQRLGFSSSFVDCNLDLSNFSQMDLKNGTISNCSCKEVYFSDTNLTKCNLSGSDFEGAVFHNTNLKSANLKKAKNYKINPFFNNLQKTKLDLPEAISILEVLDIDLSWSE